MDKDYKLIKYDDWDIEPSSGVTLGNYSEDRTYTYLNGDPITGMLEDFYYFGEGDPRNNQPVKDGKRV